MKKFIVAAAFLVAISSAAFAQTQKPPQRKTYEERMKEKKEAEELRKKEQGEGNEKNTTKKTPPARPQRPQRKSAEEKLREKKEAEEQRKALEGEKATDENATEETDTKDKKPARKTNTTKERPPRPTPASRKAKGKTDEPVATPNAAVVNTYYELPLDAIPQVRNYIEDKEDVDSKSIRRGFIRKQDAARGFIHLQLPADDKYTRIQEYKTSTGQQILAIETNNCSQGECNNKLKFYSKGSSGSWADVTEKYMPELDKKYILSKIKAKYKKDYSDLENYNNKGYETSEEIYNKAIIAGIDADANKIIIKEQYLPLPLYEMVWDGKSKFILKKL
jgi:hypothetical protein